MIADAPRLARLLERLLPHLDGADVALTGGVAVELHLRAAGRRGLRERLADVDFVARRMDAIAATIARDFLVSHFHVAQPGVPKAIVQVVDPVTRLRVDIFPDRAGMLADARPGRVAGAALRVVSAASLLGYKQQMLNGPVDEKHWRDAVALAGLCGADAPARPPRLVPDVYSTDLGLVCDRCEKSRAPAFPIAPKRAIFDLLGYV